MYNDNNKQTFFVNEQQHFRPTLRLIVCMTLNCVGLTQFNVVRIIYRNAGWACFFHLPKCSFIVSFFLHLYFTR